MSEEQGNDQVDGRSRERTQQDGVLEREARRESWLSRLLRQRWLESGRPNPRGERDRQQNEG